MDDIDRMFREYHPHIVRYLARRTGDADLAEELAQETFVRAARNLPLDNARAWLFSVATNLVRDEVKRDNRRRRHLEALRVEQADERPFEPATTSLELAQERLHTQRLVREAMDGLAERDRSALLLREEGLDYHEIASALGLSVGSIGTTLSRAQHRLVTAYETLVRQRASKGGVDVA